MKSLTELNHLDATPSDKCDAAHSFHGRSYLDYYQPRLQEIEALPGNVLEIGVCCGGSLRLWRRAFSGCAIVGLDIDPACKSQEAPAENIHVRTGSQADAGFLSKVAAEFGPFKLIVDDGSHITSHIVKSFECLWPSVAPGGWYVIEDLGISYVGVDGGWPGMKLNPQTQAHEQLRQHIDQLLLARLRAMDRLEGDVDEIHCTPMMCFFRKLKR